MQASTLENQKGKDEIVTVMVFKDHLASRSFRIPVKWFSNLGLIVGAAIIIGVVSFFFAVKFFRSAQMAEPARMIDLQRKNERLAATVKTLKDQISAGSTQETPIQETPVSTATPIPTISTESSGALFRAFSQPVVNSAQAAPITLTNLKLRWSGKKLKIQFYIHYAAKDGGNQQGRFFLMAQGKSTIQVYPQEVMTGRKGAGAALFDVGRGEYFSVSRFREVVTTFGPYDSRDELKRLDVLIFNRGGEMILNQNVPLPKVSKRTGSTPKPAVTPTAPQPETGPTNEPKPQ